MAVATESNPRTLFRVKGSAGGIEAELTKSATDVLTKAAAVLDSLSVAVGMFPKAEKRAVALADFVEEPRAAEAKQ